MSERLSSTSSHRSKHFQAFFVFDITSTSGLLQQAQAESTKSARWFIRLLKPQAQSKVDPQDRLLYPFCLLLNFNYLFPCIRRAFTFHPAAMPPVVAFAVVEC